MKKKTKKIGRPSKYKPSYCKEIIKFFDIDYYKITTETYYYKNGESKETEKLIANDLPFISAFARSIDVNQDTLHEWAKKHPEFSEALKAAKELQKEMLITNGLQGNYAQPFAIFTAKNILGWRDSQDIKHSGDAENPIQVIVKGVDLTKFPKTKK